MNRKVICIQGPTASGKSGLAERLARELDGEIVSADSMQIYRGMDIGTAKVMPEERGVPYHCIDFLDPGEPYSAALFQRDARAAFEDIDARGKVAVLAGGTGLYVRAALDDMEFAPGDQEENPVREQYTKLAEEIGPEALHKKLEEVDPASAAAIHPNNVRRVIRAFEMLEAGESYAQRKDAFKSVAACIPSYKIAIHVDREVLYDRINRRVDEMFEQGLLTEVEVLLAKGFREGLTAQQAIGYKEVVAYLDGACSLDEAKDAIKQATRRYSKRQRSWLRADKEIQWLDATDGDGMALFDKAMAVIKN